jgi:type IV secretory pathway TrbD component
MKEKLLGFEIPIHQSITSALLILGVPRNLFMLNATMAMAFILGMSALYMIPIFGVIHLLCMVATKQDQMFFEIFIRHRKLKPYYSA